MISTSYSLDESLIMLKILGKNKTIIMTLGSWPEHIKNKYFEGTEFYFRNNKTLITRTCRNDIVAWSGPLNIDSFWEEKISQSLSFECAKQIKVIQKKRMMPGIGNLLCKFFGLKSKSLVL